LLGHPDAEGKREVHAPLAEELTRQQARFGRLTANASVKTDAA
jgi:hypothetical protein